ncbi:integrase catalytic domain-containing protein [Trichonephila clavipes]|nr:integrase catalytic domain-containing protein [Trichonephila clavipes]
MDDLVIPAKDEKEGLEKLREVLEVASNFSKDYGQKDLVTRVARWTLLLEEYDYEIVHRSGQRMQHVDALSRFDEYCTEENFQNLQITTGVPRGNGQVERIHRTLIPVLTKLSIDDPTKWYKFVDRLQRILNSTSNRSTKWSPFELLTGVTMRNKEDLYLRNLLMEEMVEELQEQRNQLQQDAKRNIQKIQAENKKNLR